MNNNPWDVIVIGGGAAGFFTAIHAKSSKPTSRVLILEAGQKLLSKVKISGGGRCNVTHDCFDPKALLNYYPRGNRKLQNNFHRFGPKQTVEWFEERGVPLKTEADGRIFPTTNDSQTIIDCLMGEIRQWGISIQTGSNVAGVTKIENDSEPLFQLSLSRSEETLLARNLVLATGGSPAGYAIADYFGHQCVVPIPSLFTFCVNDSALTELAGISVNHVTAKLIVDGEKPDKTLTQSGPLLITHWGLSGPAILKLSAFGARLLASVDYKAIVAIDFFPEQSFDELRQQLLNWKAEHYLKQIKNAPSFLPERLWHYCLVKSGLGPTQMLDVTPQKPFNKLAEQLKRWEFNIDGKGQFKEEFVTAGGVPLNEIDLKTYQSKRCQNLYIVGELLNIDGVTGGFNFQNAWTSGYIAGNAI